MSVLKSDILVIRSTQDVVIIRQTARKWAAEMGFSEVDQTKIMTAASELTRNTLVYGGGGTARLEALTESRRNGLRLTFEDQGPGIPDIDQALKDGFSTGSGLGLGLSGSKRLMSEFHLFSRVGEGTRVTVTKWT